MTAVIQYLINAHLITKQAKMKNTEKKNLFKCFFKTQWEYRTINIEKTTIMALTPEDYISIKQTEK